MAVSIEDLLKEKERIAREAADVDERLQDAMRRQREEEASKLLVQLFELTRHIDSLKEERHKLLIRVRDAAPSLGDFTYCGDDYRLTLHSARGLLKQPELLDRVLAAFADAKLHVEPHAPRFRIFHDLRVVGTLHVSARRISITAGDVILDASLIEAARDLDAKYPGIAVLEMASAKKVRRVREDVPARAPDGDYATSITVHASDTGTLDSVLPLALRCLECVAAFSRQMTPETEERMFEPWPNAA